MQEYAAPDATWGITGPQFLGMYAVLAIAVIVLGMVLRGLARRPSAAARRRNVAPYNLDGVQMAYLAGGPRRAVAASLAGLHTEGAVISDRKRLRRGGDLPAGATPLDRAVHRALADADRGPALTRHRSVAAELSVIEKHLYERGLLVRPSLRRWAANANLLLFAVLALGVARLIAGVLNDRPVGYLVMLLIGIAIVLAFTVRLVPFQTSKGTKHLRKLRSRHSHLRPELSPATSTYGAATAAIAVGLFGTSVLWQTAPAFAAATGINNNVTGVGGSGFGSGSGGAGTYAGGGDSGGGGGGGCGGGGGGGCGG